MPQCPPAESPETGMPIDYEVEYNNRARVPEHADIFLRWQRDAAAYRDAATAERRAELAIAYGARARETLDLFAPEDGHATPLALFIHGGYWRSLEPSMFSHCASGLNARGVTVAVAGYELCPQAKIADIIDAMRQACLYLWRRFGRRMMVYGHSAGGHLTACMVATDWKALAPDAPADLVPAGYSISGLFDLAPLVQVAMNEDLRLDAEEAHRVSPLYWPVMPGRALDAVVGGQESSEFLRQSKTIAEAWRQGEAETRYEEVSGKNHFTILDPLGDPNSAMVARLAELCARTRVSLI
jgi:arylformamidase